MRVVVAEPHTTEVQEALAAQVAVAMLEYLILLHQPRATMERPTQVAAAEVALQVMLVLGIPAVAMVVLELLLFAIQTLLQI